MQRPHASSASLTAEGAEGDVIGGLRCWLVPADDGGYDQICVTEGKTFIGAAESDYYFSETKGMEGGQRVAWATTVALCSLHPAWVQCPSGTCS